MASLPTPRAGQTLSQPGNFSKHQLGAVGGGTGRDSAGPCRLWVPSAFPLCLTGSIPLFPQVALVMEGGQGMSHHPGCIPSAGEWGGGAQGLGWLWGREGGKKAILGRHGSGLVPQPGHLPVPNLVSAGSESLSTESMGAGG